MQPSSHTGRYQISVFRSRWGVTFVACTRCRLPYRHHAFGRSGSSPQPKPASLQAVRHPSNAVRNHPFQASIHSSAARQSQPSQPAKEIPRLLSLKPLVLLYGSDEFQRKIFFVEILLI